MRALVREPAAVDAFLAEAEAGRGGDRRLDAALDALPKAMADADEAGARRLVEQMALTLQGSLLVRHSPPYVADAFCASRLGEPGDWGHAFGTLPSGVDTAAVLARATPAA
jgi:putative acyl-CoA dehydrogenase